MDDRKVEKRVGVTDHSTLHLHFPTPQQRPAGLDLTCHPVRAVSVAWRTKPQTISFALAPCTGSHMDYAVWYSVGRVGEEVAALLLPGHLV